MWGQLEPKELISAAEAKKNCNEELKATGCGVAKTSRTKLVMDVLEQYLEKNRLNE
jgi:hypothetical protein